MKVFIYCTFCIFYISFNFLNSSFARPIGDTPSISVSGECLRKIQPDTIRFNFLVDLTRSSQKKSTGDANRIYKDIESQVRKLNLKELELNTSEYSTFPNYQWENRKKVLKGFKTRINLVVETKDTQKSGKLSQIGSGVNSLQVSGPNPFVSRKLYNETYKNCLASAAKDAKSRAEKLAKSLNVKLGKPLLIVDKASGSYGPPMPQPFHAEMAMAKSASMDAAPNINIGKQQVQVNVQVSFRLLE